MRRPFALALSLALPAPAYAQSGRGDLEGFLLLEDPGPVVVTVTMTHLTQPELRYEARTDPAAPYHNYRLAQVRAGPYVVRFAAPGHRCYEVRLHIGSDHTSSLAVELPRSAAPAGAPEPCSHGGF